MKITGLITDYNPFHTGHLYHIRKSKEVTGSDYCIALMSGSYVQRGAPAIYDKYVRTAAALSAGADLVVEMPVSFSTASAMEFASYSIALFSALGIDSVCFGSECGDIAALTKIAGLLSDEPVQFKEALRTYLKNGMTFPEARHRALLSFLDEEEQEILNSPNNTLGIEYIKAGMMFHSPLDFYTIQREGQAYHDTALLPEKAECFTGMASASAIRALVESAKGPASANGPGDMPAALRSMVPEPAFRLFKEEIPVFPDDFSTLLNYRILGGGWERIAELTPELDARIRKSAALPVSFEEWIRALKTRQLTYTRVSRALLHLILDIQESDICRFKASGYAPYARILGFRKDSGPLLSRLKHSSCIPLITKLADAGKKLDKNALSMLEQEIRSAHIYQMIRHTKGGTFRNEYTQGVIISGTGPELQPCEPMSVS